MNREADRIRPQELQCEIVQDLLPLYHDGVVNDVTSETVKHHLSGCEVCRKEYEMLCDDFPPVQNIEEKSATKSGFDAFKKKTIKRQVIRGILIGAGVFVILAILGYVLKMPLVPVQDEYFTVKAIYRIKDGDETRFFFAYELPPYEGALKWDVETVETEEGVVLQANMKRPVICRISDSLYNGTNIDLVSLEENDNIEAVTFGGKVIWTEEENGTDEVPEYVYLYAGCTDSTEQIDCWVFDETMVGVTYTNGKQVYWDYDGNVILEAE